MTTPVMLTDEERDYLWKLLDEDAEDLRHAKTAVINDKVYEENFGCKLKTNINIRSKLASDLLKKSFEAATSKFIYPAPVTDADVRKNFNVSQDTSSAS